MIKNIVLVIGFIMIIATYYKFVIKGVKTSSIRIYEKAEKNNWITTGTAISQSYYMERDNNPQKYRVKYEYFVDGKKYFKTYTFEEEARGPVYPDQVTLYYDKKNPRKAYMKGTKHYLELKQRSVGCLMCIVIPAVLLGILAKILGI